jgi:hypothetical protein
MTELLASCIKLAYEPHYNLIVENYYETEVSKVHRNLANCPSFEVCLNWTKYHKNISILLPDISAEVGYATGDFVGENSKPLLCRLEDGVIYSISLTMLMFHGDPLLRRVNEIIDRVVETGLYNYWISLELNFYKIDFQKIAIVQQLEGYYSFNLYHLQTAFYLLLMGWCLSALCFMGEVLYNRVLNKIM